MDKDEEILFEDLDDEMVSLPDDDYLLNEEEQPNEGVPSNSNGRKINNIKKANYHENAKRTTRDTIENNSTFQANANNFKTNHDFQKNNKATIDRLNDVKAKGQGLNKGNLAAQAGKELGNKLAGKSEEEKSGLEKATDDIGGKAAGAAITAATGGAISGPAAEALGNAAYQLAKKQFEKKVKKYLIIGGIISFIVLIFIIIIVSNEDDEQRSSSSELNSYVTGTMSDEDLQNYLVYIGVCTEKGENYELSEEDEKRINTADCKYAKQYFRKIKSIKERFNQQCTKKRTEEKDINDPCEVELNVPLLHETLSYGKSNNELWNKRATPDQEKDIEELSKAMTEYVWESCYIIQKKYYDEKGYERSNKCDKCTEYEVKVDQDWYYFQLNFEKYIAFLKYGHNNSHPYYSSGKLENEIGEYSQYNIWKSDSKNYIKFGENHDHICVGPNNSSF